MRALTKLPSYLLTPLLLLFFGCDNDASKKAISLDEIRPKSSEQSSQKSEKTSTDTLRPYFNYYANDSARVSVATIKPDTTSYKHFLNRFTPTRQHLILTDSSDQVVQYSSWSFKDSNSCIEAFYNWLDQAGKNQSSVALRTGNIANKGFESYIISDKQIVRLVSMTTIPLQQWLLWYSGTPQFTTIKYIIYAQPKKKSKWLKYENAKLSTL